VQSHRLGLQRCGQFARATADAPSPAAQGPPNRRAERGPNYAIRPRAAAAFPMQELSRVRPSKGSEVQEAGIAVWTGLGGLACVPSSAGKQAGTYMVIGG